MKDIALALVLILLFGCIGVNPPSPIPPAQGNGSALGISLPEGFSISVYADVPGARSLALGDGGTVFVGTRGDKVYSVRDADHDNVGESVIAIAQGLNTPNGVAFRSGDLYVAEVNRVLRFSDIEADLQNPAFEVVNSDFPSDALHGWKFIAFGPDGKLYVPVGAPCNSCDRPGYASIYRMNADGSGKELFASGIRNTVGFDWQPGTGELYFTDNGRDLLGNDIPPDELNRAEKQGLHFGFPYCHGKNIYDPDFDTGGFAPCLSNCPAVEDQRPDCLAYRPPVAELGPHVAALGMRFYTGSMFPQQYRGRIFIAEHGSWNRDEKIGYRVMMVSLDGEKATYEPFASGWLNGSQVSGRPVDVLVMPDGSMLISDDYAGKIYRITYGA